MTTCRRYKRPLPDGHAERLCAILVGQRHNECVECDRGAALRSMVETTPGIYQEDVMGKKRVFRKACPEHGEYEASGPRSACPECKGKVAAMPDLPPGGVVAIGGSRIQHQDSVVLEILMRLGKVDKSTVDYLRQIVTISATVFPGVKLTDYDR